MAPAETSGKQVVLITGASAGFGKACAEHLSSRGYRVYGTSRSARFDAETASGEQQPFTTIPMDVCDASSVKTGITYLLDKEEKIDIVVNNAGFGLAGAFEDCSVEEVKGQFETIFQRFISIIVSIGPYIYTTQN